MPAKHSTALLCSIYHNSVVIPNTTSVFSE